MEVDDAKLTCKKKVYLTQMCPNEYDQFVDKSISLVGFQANDNGNLILYTLAWMFAGGEIWLRYFLK
jgi:hypothetical protein